MSNEPAATGKINAEAHYKVKLPEILAYGSGNYAYCVVWLPLLSFLNYFWTDIVMIPAAVVGTFMLVVRIWDAINDPIIGNIEDRSLGKHGKYRPWIWTWIGIVIFFVLCFTKLPFGSQTAKNVFAFAMYFLLVVFYTTYEMAHVSLMNVATTDFDSRSMMTVSRQTFSNFSGIIGAALFMKIAMQAADPAIGYRNAAMVLAATAIPFFIWCFFGTKERVRPDVAPKEPLGHAIGAFFKCKPVILLCLGMMCWGFGNGINGAVNQYYFVYNVGAGDAYGNVMTWSMIGMFASGFAAAWLQPKFKNKGKFGQLGGLLAAITWLILFLIPASTFAANVKLYYAIRFFQGFFGNFYLCAHFGSVPDVIEYEQVHNGNRSAGTFFALINFGFKAAQAIGSSVANFILSGMGYVPGAEQSPALLRFFNIGAHLSQAIFCLIIFLLLFGYKIDRDSHQQMVKDLSE